MTLTADQIEASKARRAAEKEKLSDGTIKDRVEARVQSDEDFARDVSRGWKGVVMDIQARAATATPVPKDFEVHHEIEVARDAYIIALDESGDAMTARDMTKRRLTEAPEPEEAAPGL